MDPASIAVATSVGVLFRDYGALGAAALFLAGVVFLYQVNQKLHIEQRTEGRALIREMISAINDSATQRARLSESIDRLSDTTDEVVKALVQSRSQDEVRDTHWRGWSEKLDDRLNRALNGSGRR